MHVVQRLGILLGRPSKRRTDAACVGRFSSLVRARQVVAESSSSKTPSKHLRGCGSWARTTSVGYLEHGITLDAEKKS